MGYTSHVRFDASALIAGSSLTNSNQNILVMTGDACILLIGNTCNLPIIVNIPEVNPDDSTGSQIINLVESECISIDFRMNEKILPKGTITAKYAVSVPTSGYLSIKTVLT